MNSRSKTFAELNRDVARKIHEDARRDPQSPYAGKFVGIVRGQVVVVTEDLDELGRELDASGAEPADTFWIDAGADYDRVEEIWGCP